ncbi:MAG: hypothetical protein ABSD21_04080 [Rhizomicrobium sp.]|jgi:hypothetical protein
MKYRIICIATASALASLLAGCSTYHSALSYIHSDKASDCPDAAILANTSSLPAFNPATEGDPSGVIYSIAMTNVKTRCDYDKSEKTADARLNVYFQAKRPPGGREVSYRVPYYVAVTSGGEIIDKKIYWLEFAFPASAVSSESEAAVDSTIVKYAKDKTGYDYHFVVGFQLTKAQLDYNNKIGPYEP